MLGASGLPGAEPEPGCHPMAWLEQEIKGGEAQITRQERCPGANIRSKAVSELPGAPAAGKPTT